MRTLLKKNLNYMLLHISIRNIIFCFIILKAVVITAQTPTAQMGSWAMLFNQTRLHNKWSLHSEVQFRSYDIKPNTEQLLLRGGINFHFNPHIVFTAGYGWITNYVNDERFLKPQTANENRLWEQIILKSTLGRMYIEHRYRFEQRWIETNSRTNYNNRIRYLLRVTIPVNNKEISRKTLFASFYNEVFINLHNVPFDRNRLYGAIGFQFSSSANIQLGYMLQAMGNISKQYLQFGINYNPDLRKIN